MRFTALLILASFFANLVVGYRTPRYDPYAYERANRRRWYWSPFFIGKRATGTDDQQVPCKMDSDCADTQCCLRKLSAPTDSLEERQGICSLIPQSGDLCVLDGSGLVCPCSPGLFCRQLPAEQVGLCWKKS